MKSLKDIGIDEKIVAGVTRKGFVSLTEIQKKAIPLILGNKDLVAMAKTGSGKTAAFLIPILHKLNSNASGIGTRCLIMSPTRELAMQTLQFAKEFGKFTGITAATVLGGEKWDSQFAAVLSKPDIIIATPGRFLHLCVEMNLKLDFIQYVVFDEADRLFDMGFDYQMKEIMARLPSHRQTMLFSATLPKILVEFAKAGLSDPALVRLDKDGKISPSLTQTFFNVNEDDKVALLVHTILELLPIEEHTLIFVPTKHHCEYIAKVLSSFGIPNTYIYSSLDSEFRQISMEKFKRREVNHLIATDVAARGIDIPFLNNVVNFNFPAKPKLYFHRVGRVARAGRTGTSYSFVAPNEIPHLIDVELFMNKKIRFSPKQLHEDDANTKKIHLLLGRVPMSIINSNNGSIYNITQNSDDLPILAKAMNNAFQKFSRTKEIPSSASIKRQKNDLWGSEVDFHPLLVNEAELKQLMAAEKILQALSNYRPNKVTFANKESKKICTDIGILYKDKVDQHMKQMTVKKEQAKQRAEAHEQAIKLKRNTTTCSEDLITETFKKKKIRTDDQKAFFIPYKPEDYHAEQGYSIGTKFENETAQYSFDVGKDVDKNERANASKWDRKRKKYVNQQKPEMLKTESGQWIKKSYRTDKYFRWKASTAGRLFKKQAAVNSERPDKFTVVNKREDRFNNQKVHAIMKGKEQKNVKDKVLNEDQVKKKIKLKKQKMEMMKRNKERNEMKRKNRQKNKVGTGRYKKTKAAKG